MTDHRQHDDPLAGLLKRTLASQASTHADCPQPEILAAYFERSLAAAESAGWEQHFSACTRCQEQLAVLARVASALAPAASAPSAAQPHPRPDATGARGFASFWNLRWLAPAAAALAAVTVWVVLTAPDRRQELHSGDASTIAQNRQAPPPASGESRADAPAEQLGAKPADEDLQNREGKAGLRSQPEDAAARPDPIGSRAAAAKNDKDVAANVGRTEAGAKSAYQSRRVTAAQPPNAAELPKQPGADHFFNVRPMAPAEPAKREPAPLLDTKAASEFALEADKQKAKQEQARAADQVAALAAAKPAPPPTAPPPSAQDKIASAPAPARRARINEGQGIAVTRDDATQAKKADAPAASQPAQGALAAESSKQALEMRIHPPPAPRGFFSVPVTDSQVLWRFGPAGSIERSTDSGATWLRQSGGVAIDLLAGSAPAASVCWAAGRAGVILRTTDRGSTWVQLGSPSSLDLVAIEARDAASAVVTTSEGKRYATSDAGRTWKSQ
ncbi:MAG: YCF48-related protein [Candidatus Acidiferrales bacterium]